MAADLVSLLYIPDPVLDESPASWMMRVCQYHESYPNKLLRLFGLPRMADYDRALGVPELVVLTQGTKICREKIICLGEKFQHVRNDFLAKIFLLVNDEKKALYRYCPQCLATDRIPYWRWTWRMAHVHYCEHHQCELLSHCLLCGQILTVAGLWKPAFGEDDLSPVCCYCTACRADLRHFSARKVPLSVGFQRVLSLQQIITAALVYGHFFVNGIKDALPLRFLSRTILLGGYKGDVGEHLDSSALLPVIRDFLAGDWPQAKNNVFSLEEHESMRAAMRLRIEKRQEEYFFDEHYILRY